MLNQLINILLMTLLGTAQGVALEQMLETNPKIKSWFRIAYWTFLASIPSLINVLISSTETTVVLRNTIHWVLALIAVAFFYTDPVWRRILGIVLAYFGMSSADLVLLVVVQFTGVDIQLMYDKTNSITTFFVGVATGISIVCISALVIVWKKVFYKGSHLKYFPFFLVYTIGYVSTLLVMEFEIWGYTLGNHVGCAWAVLTGTICEVALLIIIFSQSEKEDMERKLSDSRQKAELEKIHYQQVAHRRKEILEISRNNLDVVREVRPLLEDGRLEDAEQNLMDLLHKIEQTKEYPYCDIPIVNVILSEKQKICETEKIKLEVELNLPEQLNIKQMELCSIFSNLLDNAIRASKQVVDVTGEAGISLKAGVTGNYLIIKCVNPSLKEPGIKPEGNGYGFKILKDIAGRYHGDFRTIYENGNFQGQITLQWKI